MSGLPPALAPWAAQLSGFAPELAVSLGGWVRRLAAAIGPPGGGQAGMGEPDGLVGISRRGPYERLLVSEWLLADALPHEFVRRAAAGEHLFLQRGVRSALAERRSVALLDAGPDQLGTPRIAQLALLVVLAARAEAAAVRFSWGIAQDRAGGLAEGFGEAQARRFLASRSPRPPGEDALRAWEDALPPAHAADDRWLVGGPDLLAHAPPRATSVRIGDTADPDAREVLVEVRRAGARREVALPLPPRGDCTRLLRDPFRVAVAAPVPAPGRIVPEAGVMWAPSGRRIAARLGDGAVLDVHVPSSPREPPGRRKRHRADGLVGFGWARRRQVMLATRHEELLLLALGRGDLRRAAADEGVALPDVAGPGTPLAACFASPLAEQQVLIHHPSGVLFLVKTGATSPRVRIAATAVTAIRAGDSSLAYVTAAGAELELVVLDRSLQARSVRTLGPGTGRAFLSSPLGWTVAAHEKRDGSWTALLLGGDSLADGSESFFSDLSLRPPGGTTVVGATLGQGARPALLLLEGDRRDFTLLGDRGSRLVHGAGAEVVAAAVSPAQRAFAYTTRDGALVVSSLEAETVLLRVVTGEEPSSPARERRPMP